MSVTTTYPGVYITEIPSGSRTITGVATSITAFVGTAAARAGATSRCRSPASPTSSARSAACGASSGLGYAVRDFYLNGGGEALVVRSRARRPGRGDEARDRDAGRRRAGA